MAVYFLRQVDGDRLIKIGKSKNVETRKEQLEYKYGIKTELMGVIDGSHNEEGLLHKAFSLHRVYDEWFFPCEALVSFIENYSISLEELNKEISKRHKTQQRQEQYPYRKQPPRKSAL